MSKIIEILLDLYSIFPDKSESKFVPVAILMFIVGLFWLLIHWSLR